MTTTLPLLHSAASPDAWHHVIAPGGYEWWYFDAEDPQRRLRIVVILFDGFLFHPAYLRRYDAFRASPTRRTPPVPAEYPAAYVTFYRDDRIHAQVMTQVDPSTFSASPEQAQLTLGSNTLRRADDGSLHLRLSGRCWHLTWQGPKLLAQTLDATLTFRPRFSHPPLERPFFSPDLSRQDHRWIIVNPLCDVDGQVDVGTEHFDLNGLGYHDHNLGLSPVNPPIHRWIWGRWLSDDRATVIHQASYDGAEVEPTVIVANADGLAEQPDAHWTQGPPVRHPLGMTYPRWIAAAGDRLINPRPADAAPFYMRVVYDLEGRPGVTAFCEVAYPQRLRWPLLGRMIQMSIHRESAGGK